jgi:hypothetical protein
VEWRRQGERYQVQLTLKVSPAFERRLQSDGLITAQGLAPRRFDQVTEGPLMSARQETVHFDPEEVRLANGKTAPAPAGVQDSASQFVQMTWRFLTQPELQRVGATLEFPMALPRRVGTWGYEVAALEPVVLPFATVDAYHLRPRAEGRKPNELSVEMWMAPSLQYLPVRILIHQDAETHLELTLKQPPLQAAPSR